ncbi:putative nuclease HARBI1 [Diadema antillarum]|uniref:putative nuclease HARBI1 n=1 Tax=Diadema antillarum TaxID=105358 RepID=UPI003A886E54
MAAYVVELEEEEEALHQAPRPHRTFKQRFSALDSLTDEELRKKYRFSRDGIMHIVNMLDNHLQRATARSHAIPTELQVLIALNFMATGSLFDSVASIHGVHRSTVSRCVHAVAEALCQQKNNKKTDNNNTNVTYVDVSTTYCEYCILDLLRCYLKCSITCRTICLVNKFQVIKFPHAPEVVASTVEQFHNIAGFPRVVSVIDCTHVSLHGCHLGEDEYVYINRKGRCTVNVQLACDAKFRITNCVARWPGSTHDSRIFQNSRLFQKFESGQLQGILLGDSGYPLLPYLMTPILNPQTRAEHAYNHAHVHTRSIIEQLNGQIKNKFRCLIGHGLQISPQRACNIITAACVLFNISKDLGGHDMDDDFAPANEDAAMEFVNRNVDPAAAAVRAEIVRAFDA